MYYRKHPPVGESSSMNAKKTVQQPAAISNVYSFETDSSKSSSFDTQPSQHLLVKMEDDGIIVLPSEVETSIQQNKNQVASSCTSADEPFHGCHSGTIFSSFNVFNTVKVQRPAISSFSMSSNSQMDLKLSSSDVRETRNSYFDVLHLPLYNSKEIVTTSDKSHLNTEDPSKVLNPKKKCSVETIGSGKQKNCHSPAAESKETNTLPLYAQLFLATDRHYNPPEKTKPIRPQVIYPNNSTLASKSGNFFISI